MVIFVNKVICHQFVTSDHYIVLLTDNEKLVCNNLLDSKLAISLECFNVSSQIFHTRQMTIQCFTVAINKKIGQCAQMYGFPK